MDGRHIDQQFQKNLWKHVSANEMSVKIQRLKVCFLGGSLPVPTAEVTAAWRDLPNATMDILPLSMRTASVFLRAPPPTPTELPFDADDATTNDSSLNSNSNDDRPPVDGTDARAPSVAGFRALEHDTASEGEGNSMSTCSHPNQTLEQRIDEEGSCPSTDSSSPSSLDYDSSLSSGNRSSLTLLGFHSMVNQWLFVYHAQGTDSFLESLIVFATMSVACAPLASRIARVIIRKVSETSCLEGKSLESAVRSSALEAFKKHWKSDRAEASPTLPANTVGPPTPHGINVASFMGSLFDAKISTAKEIQLCLSLLLGGTKRLDRLCAMQALLVQANDKLCKNRHLSALIQFKHNITARNEESGEYLWVTTPRSKMIITDILATIERWTLSQAHKREQNRTRLSDSHAIRGRTVGPRFSCMGLDK